MRMTGRSRLAILMCLVFALGLGSCGADPSSQPALNTDNIESNRIVGQVYEWKVEVSASQAKAGKVIFAITNFGTTEHEFLVTKTSYQPGKIPIGENDRFDEDINGIEVVDEISEWSINETRMLTVDLRPGTYELLCNLPGHYANGMHHTFIVQ